MPSLLSRTLRQQIARRFPWLRRRVPAASPAGPAYDSDFDRRKRVKLERVAELLDASLPVRRGPLFHDFLTDELRNEFHIADTSNVSAHPYDWHANSIVREFPQGWILDCGAGLRPEYFDDVVNFEICDYPTTDVRGVGERLPFRSNNFDAAFSFSVLEHVRDPFACAREIVRVLKPGGRLYCVVPFLQPFHAYPHHYYNMTAQGLAILFRDGTTIEAQEVNIGGMPIFMLTWVLRRWAEGLPAAARHEFLNLRVRHLLDEPGSYLDRPFVKELEAAARFELAATTSLFARKAA